MPARDQHREVHFSSRLVVRRHECCGLLTFDSGWLRFKGNDTKYRSLRVIHDLTGCLESTSALVIVSSAIG